MLTCNTSRMHGRRCSVRSWLRLSPSASTVPVMVEVATCTKLSLPVVPHLFSQRHMLVSMLIRLILASSPVAGPNSRRLPFEFLRFPARYLHALRVPWKLPSDAMDTVGCLHCTIGKAECVTPLADFLPSRGRVKVKASSATQVAPPSALRHECGPQNPATASAATGI